MTGHRPHARPAGFTLIELMIVTAIVGMLAAIAVPLYQTYVGRAQFTEALTLASSQKAIALEKLLQTGACVANTSSEIHEGWANADVSGQYVETVVFRAVRGGVYQSSPEFALHVIRGSCRIEARFRQEGVVRELRGKTVRLELYDTFWNETDWKCSTTVPQRYVTAGCEGS